LFYTQRIGHWAEDKPENMYRFHKRRERERSQHALFADVARMMSPRIRSAIYEAIAVPLPRVGFDCSVIVFVQPSIRQFRYYDHVSVSLAQSSCS